VKQLCCTALFLNKTISERYRQKALSGERHKTTDERKRSQHKW